MKNYLLFFVFPALFLFGASCARLETKAKPALPSRQMTQPPSQQVVTPAKPAQEPGSEQRKAVQPSRPPLQAKAYHPEHRHADGWADIAFLGDINLSRGVGKLIAQHRPGWVFEAAKPVLDQADLVVANLESPVGVGGVKYAEKSVYLKGNPEDLDVLSMGGVGLVTLANNHILDYGPEVMSQTMQGLEERGIAYTGLEIPGDNKRGGPVQLELHGLKITFLAYCSVCPALFEATGGAPGVEVALPSVMLPQIKAAKKSSDFVVVLVHWGKEYFGSNALQKKLAQALAAGGADLVIGAHTHVLQETKTIGKTLVAYNLGNFIFDLKYPVAQDSCVLLVKLKKKKKPQWKAVPFDLSSGRPEPLNEDSLQAQRIQKILEKGYQYKGSKTYPTTLHFSH